MKSVTLAFLASACTLLPQPVFAQDAAESAIILSGTGERTGASARSTGEAAARAIGRASGAIATTRQSASPARSRPAITARANSPRTGSGYRIAGNIDALEFFDVPTYRLGNGRTIRVSGELVPPPRPLASGGVPGRLERCACFSGQTVGELHLPHAPLPLPVFLHFPLRKTPRPSRLISLPLPIAW